MSDPYLQEPVKRHRSERCTCGGAASIDPDGTRICLSCGRYQDAPRRDGRGFDQVRELMRAENVPPRRTRSAPTWRGEK